MTWRLLLGITLAAYALPLEAETLDFANALTKLEEQSRPLKTAEADIQIQMAEAWEAGLLTNPLFSFEIDDFCGTRHYRGFRRAEYSISLTQPVDLNGKRSARQNVALARACKSYWNYQALRHEIIENLLEAFVETAYLHEHLKIMDEQYKISHDSLDCATEKASSGKIAAFQQKRAAIACHASLLAYEKAKTDAAGAVSAIAALIGETRFSYTGIHYPFFFVAPPHPLGIYEENLENNPMLASARMNVYIANQVHLLEKANAIPDLDVTASVGTYNSASDNAFSLEFSIPLPIFNQNQGSICRSSWQTWQANYEQKDLEIRLRSRLAIAYQRFKLAYDTVISLQGDIQQHAKETLDASQEAYNQGKIELSELLDAHRACCEIRNHYIDALKEYHLRRIEVEYIAPACGA